MNIKNIAKHIRDRRSVRTFDGRALDSSDLEALSTLMKSIENPYGIPVEFKLLNAKEHGLTCPVVVGTDVYVGGKIQHSPQASIAFGYSFEMLVLYAQSLGIGTVWLGGTMNRSAFEQAMSLENGEIMPCATPLGYPAEKMSLRERMMRRAIKADERFPFEELFFERSFQTPLTEEKAGKLAAPLEMVRWAPSAVNKQPWRAVVDGNVVHFYLKRSKGFARSETLDMQKIDIGIALCHFALGAKDAGLSVSFVQEEPAISGDGTVEYIASYAIDA